MWTAPGWLRPGARVYAIGDVHGCDDRLAALHRLVAADLAASAIAQPLLLHIGDYVDRGPNSAGVVQRLAHHVPPNCPVINLRGNHEQMLLDAVLDDDAADWLANGAEASLASWATSEAAGQAAWRIALAADLPFLHVLPLHHAVDGYVFVHAGLRPGTPLARQSAHDQLWIREAFLNHRGPFLPEAPGVAVVHGHTPTAQPELAGQRLGIDTGAVGGGPLTCAVLEGRTVRFLVV